MIKPCILLVDDEHDILDYVSSILENDYDITTADNAENAFAILKDKHTDLIVSDVMMKGMDGFELCSIVKNDVNYSHIPIILLTAKNSLQAKIEGLESGADAYVEKPFSPQYLKVQIANLLKNRSKLREYFANSPLTHLKTIAHTKEDERFLEKLHDCIQQHIENAELDVDIIATSLTMSRSTLYRKIKAISDLSPNELINLIRLKKAAELIAKGENQVGEIYSLVGYSSHKYFSALFQKQFGLTPFEYAASPGG